ncbi:MAG: hypothetical protein J7K40_04000 [candidate division Zixibacteria bacterium]|nr:hypothetical protein [candidate division Zixibacteria bacterium]
MNKQLTALLTVVFILMLAAQTWAIQLGKGKRNMAVHSYHQKKPKPEQKKEILPEIIHNPVFEIPSSEDFNISATIKNMGLGLPVVYYRFGNDKNFFKRALSRSESGKFELEIFSAALSDDKIDYYIEVTTGSKVLANYGSKDNPVTVKIIYPNQSKKILYAALFIFGIAVIWKVAVTQRAYYRSEHKRQLEMKKNFGKKKVSRAVR